MGGRVEIRETCVCVCPPHFVFFKTALVPGTSPSRESTFYQISNFPKCANLTKCVCCKKAPHTRKPWNGLRASVSRSGCQFWLLSLVVCLSLNHRMGGDGNRSWFVGGDGDGRFVVDIWGLGLFRISFLLLGTFVSGFEVIWSCSP
ncbi:hypothetical protein BO83DRAFT_88742 [Aspergillus eucalypticola CBS 122712]|uniref:Uncharacterized protein n=1 Tax=Aspergillus eucalypticola (strain CBS 122712 / IBT 29274) TaxID=1448314 RepID=A0A317V5D8_ASPEC|nr:uncharacterized protein BO83DRAFT_88742 [Aspergillus eucalypticola CBS 122712]PWY68248.1 hypothetical protein BO83DRAFT_88742 [Aspergillus eucalypticola CBS 122712]